MIRVRVVEPGFLTSVQDLGRPGYAHLGVSAGGAADTWSLRAGNRLVGNADGAPALEMTLLGGAFEFEDEATVALTGADSDAQLGGVVVPPWRAFDVARGATLRIGPLRGGARAYLCAAGGFVVPRVLGSASTDLRAGFGGVEGQALRAGDLLETGAQRGRPRTVDATPLRAAPRNDALLGVVRGPQTDWFAPAEFARLFTSTFTVREDSNRLGVRLAGAALVLPAVRESITEGVALGAVQVPPDGAPIVLFVDQQTTGGYPKPANVIAADLPRVGQLRPRDTVRFVELTIEAAHAALREREARLDDVLGSAL